MYGIGKIVNGSKNNVSKITKFATNIFNSLTKSYKNTSNKYGNMSEDNEYVSVNFSSNKKEAKKNERSSKNKQADKTLECDSKYTETDLHIDGKINASAQGVTGDCYLLTAVNALAINDPDSIKDLVKDNGDTVTVTFKGVVGQDGKPLTYEIDKKYMLELKELYHSDDMENKYSFFDDDMFAIELAYTQYREDINYKRCDKEDWIIEGGAPSIAMQELSGKSIKHFNVPGKTLFNILNSDNDTLLSFGLKESLLGKDKYGDSGKYITSSDDELYTCHAYAIVGFDGENIEYIDPANSSKILTISIDELMSIGGIVSFDYKKDNGKTKVKKVDLPSHGYVDAKHTINDDRCKK